MVVAGGAGCGMDKATKSVVSPIVLCASCSTVALGTGSGLAPARRRVLVHLSLQYVPTSRIYHINVY